MKLKRYLTCLSLIGAVFAATPASADLIFEETAPNTWRLDFDPLTFTGTKTGSGAYDWLLFKDFFTLNATVNGGTPSEQISFSINSGLDTQVPLNNVNGTFSSVLGSLGPRDLIINFAQAGNRPAINSGDTIALTAPPGGFMISINSGGVPAVPTSGTFLAGIYTAGGGGTISTDQVAVTVIPEPTSLALFVVGGGLVAFFRRRAIRSPFRDPSAGA
jgi:hypothetical protein